MGLVGSLLIKIRADAQGVRTGVRTAINELNGFNRGLKKGQTWVDAFGASSKKAATSTGSLGKALGAIGAGYVAFRAIRSVTSATEGFNQEMLKSLAIMDNVSNAMRSKMAGAARDSARVTTFSAKEAASGYFFLASAGLDAQQSVAAMPQVALFAQAAMADMATATDLVTDAQSALGMSSKSAQKNLANLTRVTDVLVAANKMANATAHQFSESLSSGAGAAAKMVGMEVEEVTAMLAAFADQGVKGAQAGTQVAIVLRDLETKAIKNAGAFRQAGISVHDADGEFRNIATIIGNMERKMAGLSDMARKKLLLDLGFSDKSVKSLQMLLGTSQKIREYEAGLRDAAGTTKQVAEDMQTAWQKGVAAMGGTFSKFSGVVQTGIDIIGTAMEGLAGIIELAFAPVEKAYKAWLHVTGQTPGPVTGAGARKYEDALADAQARADAARKRASNYRGGRGAWYDPNAAYQGSARQTAIDNDRFKKEKEAAKKAADAKKRADEEAKRQAEATKARGAQLAQGFEKPIETLNRKMKELEGLVRAGAIPREFAMRAAAAYTKEFVTNRAGPKKPYELAGAAEQGSAEAFAALMEVKTDQNNKTAETQRDDMIMIFNSVRDRLNDIFNRLDAGKV